MTARPPYLPDAGRLEEALLLLEQAMSLAIEGTWESAGLRVQQAEVLASLGRADEAEPLLLRAYEEAVAAGARMAQLGAATLLTRLADAAGRPAAAAAAAARLQEVFDTFSEGFEASQLLEARALLDEVAAPGV